MIYGINKATLVGTISEQPQFTETGDTCCATFPFLTPEIYKDKNGYEVTKKIYHICIAWEEKAELIRDYAKSGDSLYIEGRIANSISDDKNGVSYITTQIEIDNFLFLKSKKPKTNEKTV